MHARAIPADDAAPRKTGRGHIASYGEGRVCAMPDCTTTLSRYNSTAHCSRHDPGLPGARRPRL